MSTKELEPKGETKAKTPRGADERKLAFLGTRQTATPISVAGARAKTDSLAKNARVEDLKEGLVAHTQGTALNEIYMRHGDAVLGFLTFAAFLEAHWPLGDDAAYDRMRVARFFTEEQCGTWGLSVCKKGVQLLAATGAADVEALRKVDLKLPADLGGGTVRFPATVSLLKAALRELKTPSPESAEHDVSVGQKVERTRRNVRALCQENEDYKVLKPRCWAEDGEVALEIRTVGTKRMALGSEFLAKLARKR